MCAESFSLGATPTTREAQAIADEIFADFVSAEADKVELVYTKFVSLITSTPTIQTLLPLTPTGELCDLDGNCVDAAEDEIFKLTTQVGLAVGQQSVSGGRCSFKHASIGPAGRVWCSVLRVGALPMLWRLLAIAGG